jgi:hypothetical protein
VGLSVAVLGLVTLLTGCGGGTASSSQPPLQLALERTQLEQVASALRVAEPAVMREVAASRGAWPLIAGGLPEALPSTLHTAVSAASARAHALVEPSFVAGARSLTGPASGIGGIYESYERLAQRGWQLTAAAVDTIPSASPAVASFERENSSLYVDAIYDAHFDLSLLGKSLVSGYERLGGPAAFGAALTQDEVTALAGAYSIPGVRLEPHPVGGARDG